MDIIGKIKDRLTAKNGELLEGVKYPTKEEYENKILEIRKQELESSKFKTIYSFMQKYNKRENVDLEDELFEIVGTFGIEDKLIGKTYEEKQADRLERLDKLRQFLNSLSKEQVNSNLYLKMAYVFINLSVKDCGNIISILEKQIADTDHRMIDIDVDIPIETLKFLPTRISEQVAIPYYNPKAYKMDYVNLLDKENENVYSEFNNFASKLDRLASDIYRLQMNKMLLDSPYQIENVLINIYNNSMEHKFLTYFYVDRTKESDKKLILK